MVLGVLVCYTKHPGGEKKWYSLTCVTGAEWIVNVTVGCTVLHLPPLHPGLNKPILQAFLLQPCRICGLSQEFYKCFHSSVLKVLLWHFCLNAVASAAKHSVFSLACSSPEQPPSCRGQNTEQAMLTLQTWNKPYQEPYTGPEKQMSALKSCSPVSLPRATLQTVLYHCAQLTIAPLSAPRKCFGHPYEGCRDSSAQVEPLHAPQPCYPGTAPGHSIYQQKCRLSLLIDVLPLMW